MVKKGNYQQDMTKERVGDFSAKMIVTSYISTITLALIGLLLSGVTELRPLLPVLFGTIVLCVVSMIVFIFINIWNGD